MTTPYVRHEARFYDRGAWDSVTCRLCPHLCSIAPSRSGNCGVRSNRNGTLYADTYGRVSSRRLTPSPGLPLYHYLPGARWLVAGTKGCNMRCTFCDTAAVSQLGGAQLSPASPESLVVEARKAGAAGISFGVNEPAISAEFVEDTFVAAGAAGLRTHLATSGFWSAEPFEALLPSVDAITFGLKGFSAGYLTAECGGHLDLIRGNIETAIARGRHVEISYLLISEHPEWRHEIEDFARWLAEINPHIPVVVSALKKEYAWRGKSTSSSHGREALAISQEWLRHVYFHNDHEGQMTTRCPHCSRSVVRRSMDEAMVTLTEDGQCPQCGGILPIVFG